MRHTIADNHLWFTAAVFLLFVAVILAAGWAFDRADLTQAWRDLDKADKQIAHLQRNVDRANSLATHRGHQLRRLTEQVEALQMQRDAALDDLFHTDVDRAARLYGTTNDLDTVEPMAGIDTVDDLINRWGA